MSADGDGGRVTLWAHWRPATRLLQTWASWLWGGGGCRGLWNVCWPWKLPLGVAEAGESPEPGWGGLQPSGAGPPPRLLPPPTPVPRAQARPGESEQLCGMMVTPAPQWRQ